MSTIIQPFKVSKSASKNALAARKAEPAKAAPMSDHVLTELAAHHAGLETGDHRFAHVPEAICAAADRAVEGDTAAAASMATSALITIYSALAPVETAAVDDAARRLVLGLPVQATPVIRLLAAASNVLRLTTRPWHNSVLRVANLIVDLEGYPHGTPELTHGYLNGTLIDELERRPIPSAVYEIENEDGDAVEVLGPRADARGLVSVEAIRAFDGSSKAQVQRARERLSPKKRRLIEERAGAWEFPCGLAGYQPDAGRVDVRAYLAARRSGRAFAEETTTTDPDFPEIPENGGVA